MIWEKVDEGGWNEEISKEAVDLVEKEKGEGRFGAFVIRRQINQMGDDNVEVWSWAD